MGHVVNTSRHLARQMWVAIYETEEKDCTEKIQKLRLLVAYAQATKQHLRGEPLGETFAKLVTLEQFQELQKMNHPPLEVAFWISDYLQSCFNANKLNAYQLSSMLAQVDMLVEVLGGCERISKTPIPLAFAIHLKQLLLLYCLALPFQRVGVLQW